MRPDYLVMPIQMGLALVLGTILGLFVTGSSSETTLLALAGIAVAFVALSRPELLILLLVTASSSILTLNQIPTIKVGFALSVVELCLILLLGLAALRMLVRANHYVKTPLDWPIALFFLASFISLVNSVVTLGTNVKLMEYQWRILFSYLTFFAVTNLVRTRRQLLTLVTGMFAIATLVAALMVVQEAVGTSIAILPGRVETAEVLGTSLADVTRVLPPGQSLILAMFMPALMLLVSRERLDRVGWLLLSTVALLAIGLAFTFSRATWAGVAVSVGVAFLLSARHQRKNLLFLSFASIAIGVMAIILLGLVFPQIGKITNAFYLRGASLFTGDQLEYSSSWQWRVAENQYALASITQHPLLGIGPGTDYRPDFYLGGDRLTGFVHNGYYFILVDLGLTGFVPFAWFTVAYLLRGYRFRTIVQDRVFAPLALGFTLSYVVILIVSVAEPTFMYWYWTPVLGAVLGINEVIYRLNGQVSK